jgi:hypothetical protein
MPLACSVLGDAEIMPTLIEATISLGGCPRD